MGCIISDYETLAEGIAAHGLNPNAYRRNKYDFREIARVDLRIYFFYARNSCFGKVLTLVRNQVILFIKGKGR